MADRPQGRETHKVSGQGSVNKRGSGLGTGPVGNGGGPRPSGGSSSGNGMKRATGGGLGAIALIVIMLVVRGFGGGSDDGSTTTYTGTNTATTTATSSASSLSTIMNLMSGVNYTTDSSEYTSSGAATSSSKLDTTVAPGSREKRTVIKGNGSDEVTIMVYMCGTDLESKSGMASSDLAEMASANLSDKVNIIVYTGGCKQWKTSGISNSVNQIYKVEKGSLTLLEKDMGNLAMTDPNTLTEFIKYCTKNYPANRQELILWDHGGGSITGYGYDEKSAKSGSMTLSGINTALKNAGTTFDFIGFDACLMATVENGLMLSKYADYMIASEETEPGVGWYYTNWLTKLSDNTSMETIEIGKNIVDDFVDVCNRKCNGQKTTLSVVDLAELSNTVPEELSSFATSTNELIKSNKYKTVSTARSNTKEFAQSSKIDQIDLVDFAKNMGTEESEALAEALLGAVKYNRTASCVKDAYGLSIYFPLKKANKVSSVVNTYNQIGMDDEYSKCIQQFASLEVSGQISTGGTTSPTTTLSGGTYTTSTTSSSSISSLLGSLMSGSGSTTLGGFDLNSLSSLLSSSELSSDKMAEYIADNQFDATQLVWSRNSAGETVLALSEDQWELVSDIALNVFVDDGEGFIDLGYDNVFSYDSEDNLYGKYDKTWLSINKQVVAYYYTGTEDGTISGYIPAFLNGDRVELLVIFNEEYPYGYITGAKYIYDESENETVAKAMIALQSGDKLDFICDYYDYDGNYVDSYYLGETMTLGDTMEIGNIDISSEKTIATFRITDIYNQNYWTPEIP